VSAAFLRRRGVARSYRHDHPRCRGDGRQLLDPLLIVGAPQALQDDEKWAKLLLERGYGKVPDNVVREGDSEQPIAHRMDLSGITMAVKLPRLMNLRFFTSKKLFQLAALAMGSWKSISFSARSTSTPVLSFIRLARCGVAVVCFSRAAVVGWKGRNG
jgi:hypothetical protein